MPHIKACLVETQDRISAIVYYSSRLPYLHLASSVTVHLKTKGTRWSTEQRT